MFLASPALVAAKRVFQICCDRKLDWDAPLHQDLGSWWNKWKEEIVMLNNYEIPRCFKTSIGNERTVDTQLHIFADGSNTAYGAVGYIRHETENHNAIVNIAMAKSRLTPLSRSSLKTTPKIELNAAKLAVILDEKLKSKFANQLSINKTMFWSDSKTVLRYINSDTAHFQPFEANRVAYIRARTDKADWNYVPGEQNPADLLSRGTTNMRKFISDKMWINGPEFLQRHQEKWRNENELVDLSLDMNDPEMKKPKKHIHTTKESEVKNDAVSSLINSTSDMFKKKCRIATMLRLKKYFTQETV